MKQRRQGFTLIELMIVVAILGILAAIAIPSFVMFIARSKTAEASSNIKNMFTAVASYYSGELTAQSINASTGGYCTVPSAGPSPAIPSSSKQPFIGTDPGFRMISFSIADQVYYSYQLVSSGALCGTSVNNDSIYTIAANGDLDDDGVQSTFELAVGSDDSNTMYHARGIAVFNEMD